MENYIKTIETYNEVVINYENKFMEMDLYNDTYDFFCSLLNRNAKVLDVGCGPGNITKYFLNLRNDLEITGIDLAPNMVERAKINIPNANFIVKDALKINELEDLFDGIVIGFCMPYLSKEDCSILIIQSAEKLHSGGLIYISTMEDDYNKSGYETTSFSNEKEVYVYYHQEQYLKSELNNNGFEIIKTYKKDYPEPDGSFLTDLIIIATKK